MKRTYEIWNKEYFKEVLFRLMQPFVLIADEGPIIIGEKCSIQDDSTIHLHDGVTVGYTVILHGYIVKKRTIQPAIFYL